MDYVKLTKKVWEGVFGKTPAVTEEGGEDRYIYIDSTYSLMPMAGVVEVKTLKGTTERKVNGWSACVEIRTYSNESGPDSDLVDLGWAGTFGDALQLVIDAHAKSLADNIMEAEYMAEAFKEEEQTAH